MKRLSKSGRQFFALLRELGFSFENGKPDRYPADADLWDWQLQAAEVRTNRLAINLLSSGSGMPVCTVHFDYQVMAGGFVNLAVPALRMLFAMQDVVNAKDGIGFGIAPLEDMEKRFELEAKLSGQPKNQSINQL